MFSGASAARWLAGLVALLLTGCTPTPSVAPGAGPSVAPVRPPVAADLADGVAVQLGAAGHWAITGSIGFTADQDAVHAIDLTTGAPRWERPFDSGHQAWDAGPTLKVSDDGSTVLALRTVGEGELELVRIDAASGGLLDSRLVGDPGAGWRVDLPPFILSADATTAVLADDPESGRQTGVLDLASASLRWTAEDQAFASDEARVITRTGARDRLTGRPLWSSAEPLGPVVAHTPQVVVVAQGSSHQLVWLAAGSGARIAATPPAQETPDCRATATAVVCLTDGATAYDLATGERLWSSTQRYQAITSYLDWAYLWRSEDTGDVVAARSPELVVENEALAAIVFGNAAGVLVENGGTTWVSTPR